MAHPAAAVQLVSSVTIIWYAL